MKIIDIREVDFSIELKEELKGLQDNPEVSNWLQEVKLKIKEELASNPFILV